MYNKSAECAVQLLIVESTRGERIGAMLQHPWQVSMTDKFYGSTETLLFKLSLPAASYKWVGLEAANQVQTQLFVSTTPKLLAIGGGGLHFGLSIDEYMQNGTTGVCATFNN